jgi:PEP-CTERM motif-containing protein
MRKSTLVRAGAPLVAAVSTFCMASTFAFAAPNLLIDPGFEAQTTSPTNDGVGGWSLFNGAAFSTDVARTGTHSMKDFGNGSVPGSFETFPASPGQQFELTGFGLTPTVLAGNPGFGILQVAYFDAGGNNLGTVETGAGNAKASAQINNGSAINTWLPLDTGIATAPAGAVKIQAFTLVVDFNSPAAGESVYFDDLNLTAVPEPASLGIVAVAGLGLLARSRRKA